MPRMLSVHEDYDSIKLTSEHESIDVVREPDGTLSLLFNSLWPERSVSFKLDGRGKRKLIEALQK